MRQAKYDEAISQLNQADTSSPYTMFQLARAYAGKKDIDNAKNYYQKAASSGWGSVLGESCPPSVRQGPLVFTRCSAQ